MNNKCVLICEDDEGIIEITQIVLQEKGYRVITQTDASLIYTKVEEVKPDIILLDLWMNGLNGEEIARRLKVNEKTKHIPIIIMSASKDTELIARQAGADAFLSKPFDLTALEDIVEIHIEKS